MWIIQRKLKCHTMVLIFLLILLFFLGYFLSGQNSMDSQQLTDRMMRLIGLVEEQDITDYTVRYVLLKGLFRQFLHFLMYFLASIPLGLLIYTRIKGFELWLSVSFGLVFCYSMLDEIHQIFVPGRGFQVVDVVTDLSGSILGLLLLRSILYILELRQSKHKR